ncbi:MAG: phosphoenolpyruvate synthase [Candidatus Aenigmarchaeota archaeon]|nr:phosphoenolpyruvate synthase [Candidatus Aenigmarchaeota archaeon]
MEYVIWLDQISSDMISLVGGKGLHLGEMINLNLPVPAGFAITTKAFEKFLEANNIKNRIKELLQECDAENTQQLLDTSKAIKELIYSQDIPIPIKSEIVESYRQLSYSNQVISEAALKLISAGREMALIAVRSSATAEDLPTASFAGQQASFLNVKGTKDLIDAVKKCWASLFEPRAIFYRVKQGVAEASISVIIQRMVLSVEKSGVMFTTNPITGSDEIVIEATWGLGEMLVSGSIQPDRYRVSKDGNILEKSVGKKERRRIRDFATDRTIEVSVPRDLVNAQVLAEEEILRLVKYALKLENHYKRPQDIEFAIEKNKIYIVQTRPVTTEAKVEEVKITGKPILKGLGSSPGVATGKVKLISTIQDLTKIEEGDILVTKMTSPDMVVAMNKSVAIITDQGGATAHASIISRELGIPCIVGTQNATKTLTDGQVITVDAYHGVVYSGEVALSKPEEIVAHAAPIATGISTVTQVKVNLVFPENLDEIVPKTDGVGLLRIEHMITKSGIHPAMLIKDNRAEEYIKILIDGVKPIAEAFKPKPIWVRTLDARTDEFRNLEGGENEYEEDNPMLGWHGIRRSLDEPELLKAEFEAVKRMHEEGLTNVHIMLPFVVSVDEFRKSREIAKEINLPDTVKIGIMVETPAAALIIDDFCKEGIDFASIGSNDLTQGVLEADRNNAKISSLYSEFHPAVLKLMRHVIKTCNKYDIESSICGEAGSNAEMVKQLVRYGIRSVSTNIDAIDKIRRTVAETEREILKEFLHK